MTHKTRQGCSTCWVVVCKPEFSISTPALFAQIDRVRLRCHPDTRGAVAAGLCPPEVLPRLEALLARYHLPTATDYAAADLYEKTLSDKKRAGDTLSLVVPTAWGKSVLHPIPVGQLLTWIERGLGQ